MANLTAHYQDILDFLGQLDSSSSGSWHDECGIYEIAVGSHIIEPELTKLHPKHLIVPDDLRIKLRFLDNQGPGCNSNYAVSIGSSPEQNVLKSRFSSTGVSLVTVPVPLTNDSFGTNRYSETLDSPSVPGRYPCKTIFDIELLSTFPWSINGLALGEFVGLYYSAIDYFECRSQLVPTVLMSAIVEHIRRLINRRHSPKEYVREAAMALLLKCIVMRITGDHQVACGIDHMIAYSIVLDKVMPHGKAVYLGSIVSAGLCPHWQKYGVSLRNLIENGIECQIINWQDLLNLASYDPQVLIRRALDSRPSRTSVLQRMAKNTTILDEGWEKFDTATRDMNLNG